MDESFEESSLGGIQFRDKWQFEIKSVLLPVAKEGESVQTQELYIFIPNSLQINDQTYPKQQFYVDQTNLIRFRTPRYRMEELVNDHAPDSPFGLLKHLAKQPQTHENLEIVQNEVKLLGDIYRSALRDKLLEFGIRLNRLKKRETLETIKHEVFKFLDQLDQFKTEFDDLEKQFLTSWPIEKVGNLFKYVEEFIDLAKRNALTHFLHHLRLKPSEGLADLDSRITQILINEPESSFAAPLDDQASEEFILYREGLLNKYVMDPLLLKTSRSGVDQRYRNLITGIPAAVAMLIYMILFTWQWHYFIVNSEPFILLTVIIYVLKDRIKEELRQLSYKQAARWFSDYTTEIHSNGTDLGTLRESFSFIPEAQIDPKILEIRNKEFHGVLERFKRPEQVMYYKKSVKLSEKVHNLEMRFYGLTLVFRFDMHHFIAKAEDAYQQALILDPETKMIKRVQLPRVYHINIIMKTTIGKKGTPQIDKFRLIVDKSGIKRVENLAVT